MKESVRVFDYKGQQTNYYNKLCKDSTKFKYIYTMTNAQGQYIVVYKRKAYTH